MSWPEYVKVRQEQFGAVVFDTLKEKVFVANQTGGDILRLLNEGKSFQAICAALREDYEETSEGLQDEVKNFLDELKKRDLLR